MPAGCCSPPGLPRLLARPGSADHQSVVDRIVAGEAPGKLIDLHTWMGLQAPVETGKDLRRGLDPWRLDPVPKR